MPYVGRLMEDTGLTFNGQSAPAPIPSPPAYVADAPLEIDETVVITYPGVPAAVHAPIPSIALEIPRYQGSPAKTSIAAGKQQPAPLQDTKAENRRNTLASIPAWTAMAAPLEQSISPTGVVSRAPDQSPEESAASDAPARGEVRLMNRQPRPLPKPILPPAAGPSEAPAPGTVEPEVMNVNLSIGAIELTLDAPVAPAASAPPVARPSQPRATVRDSAATLRRHYYRQPIG